MSSKRKPSEDVGLQVSHSFGPRRVVSAFRRDLRNDRSALVVKPKGPFLDWLHTADPTSRHLTLQELVREPAIYLIPECDTNADVDEVLRDLCEEIFIEQLAGWFNDRTTWPQDRGFDVFRRWFDFQHHSMLVDLCDHPLVLESD